MPELVFTFPAKIGGVASFNFNIINNSDFRNNFFVKVILLKAIEDKSPIFKEKFEADEVVTFNFSTKENQYYVCKRLNKLIGDKPGALICDNDKSLMAAGKFNNPKTVYHLLHDYFYVNQHIEYQNYIDVAVAHSSFFADCIFASNPRDFASHQFYIPYGVKQYDSFPKIKNKSFLKLFFLGRLAAGKGVELLFDIEEILLKKNIIVSWTIIGQGELKPIIKKQWKHKTNVKFLEPSTTSEIYEILKEQDIFVFPTKFEGTPVAVMEALANGCAVLVNDLPGGIRDMVNNDVGRLLSLDDVDQYVDAIIRLDRDRTLLYSLQEIAWKKSVKQFNASINANNYFSLFSRFKDLKRSKNFNKEPQVSVSRLDKKFIPNYIVKLIRNLR